MISRISPGKVRPPSKPFSKVPSWLPRREPFQPLPHGPELAGVQEDPSAFVAFVHIDVSDPFIGMCVHGQPAFGTYECPPGVFIFSRLFQCFFKKTAEPRVGLIEDGKCILVIPDSLTSIGADFNLGVSEILYEHFNSTSGAFHVIPPVACILQNASVE